MSKAHRHAELMKFAADHWHEAEWRCRDQNGPWTMAWQPFVGCPPPFWSSSMEYEVRIIRRHAIQPRREVPAPETEAPQPGTVCWLAATGTTVPEAHFIWGERVAEDYWLAAGLVYLNKEDRDARVAAMLEIER